MIDCNQVSSHPQRESRVELSADRRDNRYITIVQPQNLRLWPQNIPKANIQCTQMRYNLVSVCCLRLQQSYSMVFLQQEKFFLNSTDTRLTYSRIIHTGFGSNFHAFTGGRRNVANIMDLQIMKTIYSRGCLRICIASKRISQC